MDTVTTWIPVAGTTGVIIDQDQHRDRYRLRFVEGDGTSCEVVLVGNRYAALRDLLVSLSKAGDDRFPEQIGRRLI